MLFLLMFATGLTVGFGHCTGMCGPIVVSLSLKLKERRVLPYHFFYNAGRIVTYGILGGIMGLTGSFTMVASNIEPLQKGIMILAGFFIIAMGLSMGGWIRTSRIFEGRYSPTGFLSRGFQRLSSANYPYGGFPLGLLFGLLPCGPVYTALIASARAGMESSHSLEGSFQGMALMLAFGLGTAAPLLLVAGLAELKWFKRRALIYKISSGLMIATGVYFVIKGFRYPFL